MQNTSPVLLAEDEEHDIFFMRRAFDTAGVQNKLMAVQNGREVIRYLEGKGEYADRHQYPEPALLLVDLKMPLIDGFEVMSWIRSQPRWRDQLSILVFSSSAEEQDKRKAFELGAHEYLVKPSNFHELLTLVRDLKRRWLDTEGTETDPRLSVNKFGASLNPSS